MSIIVDRFNKIKSYINNEDITIMNSRSKLLNLETI